MTTSPIVKVCGIRTVEAAQVALDAGANMIGMIMVPNRARTVDMETAGKISRLVRSYRRQGSFELDTNELGGSTHSALAHIIEAKTRTRPAIVGVFRNQPLSEVLRLQQELSLDFVQLHGSEPLEWCRLIPCPVIRRFTPDTPDFYASPVTGYHSLSLIDGEVGGEGKMVDWSGVQSRARMGARFLMAGGLTADNVAQALAVEGACGVDVSGGVESSPGVKDLNEIERFVKAAKGVTVKY
uniref:N-(5'-phosphoribosyl)anthranilate isomerase n=1 Tax=Blastobotrys adeninivorans TaxID=409370 RepID=Q1M2R6_BLAAD|nr:phosphoribosylanthranilate isomerase [Blastobotrys adeninivorans]